jgi:hypothetical protein
VPSAEDIKNLFAEFPKEDIHWRAQSVTKDGSKAMALAYINARDVMDRLDAVCGAADWQDRYEVHGGRVVCYLSIRVDDEWVTKADGAGDTAVEAEKGGLSDAFKRAAVKWGIGRYLYGLDAPWVPCETYESNGRKHWKRWTADPWSFVKGAQRASAASQKRGLDEIAADLNDCNSLHQWKVLGENWRKAMDEQGWSEDYRTEARALFEGKRSSLKEAELLMAG